MEVVVTSRYQNGHVPEIAKLWPLAGSSSLKRNQSKEREFLVNYLYTPIWSISGSGQVATRRLKSFTQAQVWPVCSKHRCSWAPGAYTTVLYQNLRRDGFYTTDILRILRENKYRDCQF
ncbi:hypothetical protein AVEN_89950-1 [Araneus ventricosus]|uniref:Uncharacterized protein n=1 Tax=Araneus ventricosus TaxID=182803 RepID=A0A4Y2N104_ARAVE|nr:hypothetical protein AVEN_89950-1 [Araneus ventricosus]